MITRTVRLQLAAFALLSVTLVAILSASYVGLTDKIAGGSYVVSADLAQSGGIFVGAEVTYRGVTVGKVEALRLSGDGVAGRREARPWHRDPEGHESRRREPLGGGGAVPRPATAHLPGALPRRR